MITIPEACDELARWTANGQSGAAKRLNVASYTRMNKDDITELLSDVRKAEFLINRPAEFQEPLASINVVVPTTLPLLANLPQINQLPELSVADSTSMGEDRDGAGVGMSQGSIDSGNISEPQQSQSQDGWG